MTSCLHPWAMTTFLLFPPFLHRGSAFKASCLHPLVILPFMLFPPFFTKEVGFCGFRSKFILVESTLWARCPVRGANCTARRCSPLRRKYMKCSINSPALSLLMKHLVIGQRLKTPNFSAFHWSPDGSLVSIGQNFVTFTEKDRNKLNYRIGPKRT